VRFATTRRLAEFGIRFFVFRDLNTSGSEAKVVQSDEALPSETYELFWEYPVVLEAALNVLRAVFCEKFKTEIVCNAEDWESRLTPLKLDLSGTAGR